MLKFKQIMRRRLDVFSSLKTHIEISGLLGAKPLTARELQLKEELKSTFKHIKDIAALRAPFYSSSNTSRSPSPTPLSSLYPKLTFIENRGLSRSQMLGDADSVVGMIRRSMENVKNLDKIARGGSPDRQGGKDSPFERSNSLISFDATPRRIRRKSANIIPIRSWNEAISGKSKGDSPVSSKVELRTESVRNKRRMSSEGFFRANRVETGVEIGSTLIDADKRKRIQKLLTRQISLPRSLAEEDEEEQRIVGRKMQAGEEVTTDMIKDWRQKDLEYWKSCLSDSIIKTADKKNGYTSRKKTMIGIGDVNTEDDNKSPSKQKKKKKRNPNISTSSGSVTTTLVKSKFKKVAGGDNGDGSVKSGYKNGVLIEEEDEEEDISPFIIPKETELSHLVTKETAKPTVVLTQQTKETVEDKSESIRNNPSVENTPPSLSVEEPSSTKLEKNNSAPASHDRFKRDVGKSHSPVRSSASLPSNNKHHRPLQTRKFLTPLSKSSSRNDMSDIGGFQSSTTNAMDYKTLIPSSFQPSPIPLNTHENLEYKLDVPGIESKNLESRRTLDSPVGSMIKDPLARDKSIHNFAEIQQEGDVSLNNHHKENSSIIKPNITISTENKSFSDSKEKPAVLKDNTPMQNSAKKAVLKNIGKLGLNSNDLMGKGTTKIGSQSARNNSKPSTKGNSKKSTRVNETAEKSKFIETNESDMTTLPDKKKKNNSSGQLLDIKKLDSQKAKDLSPSNKLGELASGQETVSLPVEAKPRPSLLRGKTEVNVYDKEKPKIRLTKIATDQEIPSIPNLIVTEPGKEPKISRKFEDLPKIKIEVNKLKPKEDSKEQDAAVNLAKEIINKNGKSGQKSITQQRRPSELKKMFFDQMLVPKEEDMQSQTSVSKIEDVIPEEEEDNKTYLFHNRDTDPDEGSVSFNSSPRRSRRSIRPPSEVLEEDILGDPLKLFNEVLNINDVDQETKLDLFFYGNRKEALKDFIKEVENTIQHNILKQGECTDQLADFFDPNMTGMLVSRGGLKYNQRGQEGFSIWKEKSAGNKLEADYLPQTQAYKKQLEDFAAERGRKQAFQQQQILLNTLRATAFQKATELGQASMGTKTDNRVGEIILGAKAFEHLLMRQDSAIFELNKLAEEPDELEAVAEEDENERKKRIKEEEELRVNLEKLRKFLAILKKHRPDLFERFVEEFLENKLLYDKTAKDIARYTTDDDV